MTTEGVFSGQTVGIGVGGTGRVNVTISIDGHSGAFGYKPHGTAQMEYYRHVPIGTRTGQSSAGSGLPGTPSSVSGLPYRARALLSRSVVLSGQ